MKQKTSFSNYCDNMSISRDNFDLPTSSIKMLSVFSFSSDKELTDNCIALMRLMIAHIILEKKINYYVISENNRNVCKMTRN